MPVHFEDDVALPQAGVVGRTTRLNISYDGSVNLLRGLKVPAYVRREVCETKSPTWFSMLAARGLIIAVSASHRFQRDRNVDDLTLAHDFELDGGTRTLLAHLDLKLAGVTDGLSVESSDHVSSFQPGLGSGRSGLNLGDDCAFGFLQVEEFGVFGSHITDPNPHVSVGNLTVLDQRLYGRAHDLCWYGEAHARKRAGGRDQESIDSDHLAPRIH